jgi:hypothetical protein
MTRAREIRDLKIDEVSLVDKGANQHAKTVIAKRHDVEEETTVEKYFNEDGDLIDLNDLQAGDHVWDAQGQEFEFTDEVEEDDDEADEDIQEIEDAANERELAEVGKSVFAKRASSGTSLADQVRVELSKALTDKDRDEVIAKVLGQVEDFAEIAKAAQATAAAERDMRLTAEYTEIAKGYNVPVKPSELGRVLKRLAEVLPVEDQMVIKKCLEATSASQELFDEYGHQGGGDNVDILQQVDALVDGTVYKGDLTREDVVSKVFDENPDAYDQYLAERRG